MGRQLSSAERAWRTALRAARAYTRARERIQGPRQGCEARRAKARMDRAFAECDPPPADARGPVGAASAGLSGAIKRAAQARIQQWKDSMSSGMTVCRPAFDF
eukprot:6842488-Alexandrium_andersonii.AAC.1